MGDNHIGFLFYGNGCCFRPSFIDSKSSSLIYTTTHKYIENQALLFCCDPASDVVWMLLIIFPFLCREYVIGDTGVFARATVAVFGRKSSAL